MPFFIISVLFQTHIPDIVGEERLEYFPRTSFSENSTTFDLTSENYHFVNSSSRLALEVLIIHGENVRNGSVTIVKTMDDEYTPSVFSSYTYQTSGAFINKTRVGYVQWKPISYQSNSRKSTSSQQLNIVSADMPEDIDCEVDEVPAGLASSLYGTDFGHGNITHWFVVFGTAGDPTYLSPSYNTWLVMTCLLFPSLFLAVLALSCMQIYTVFVQECRGLSWDDPSSRRALTLTLALALSLIVLSCPVPSLVFLDIREVRS